LVPLFCEALGDSITIMHLVMYSVSLVAVHLAFNLGMLLEMHIVGDAVGYVLDALGNSFGGIVVNLLGGRVAVVGVRNGAIHRVGRGV
jgi:hypothetical protein